MIKLAVIGDPISHSLSPLVHGAALDLLGVPYRYEKIQVKKGGLEKFLDYVKREKIDGFNLTMPHKTDIIQYLDRIDSEAELFGSVNTVKVKDGKLLGYNTDGDGYLRSLKTKERQFSGSKAVILGAGGVVQTLALKAANEGAAEIRILNRTAEKAEETAKKVRQKTGVSVFAGRLSNAEISEACTDCDILINATPLGMHGVDADFEDLSFLECLPKSALVSDLIYNPSKTRLLQKAEETGLSAVNGLRMLIFQALIADKIYLDMDFDLEKAYKEAERAYYGM